MRTLYQEPPPLLKDLKVTIQEISLIFPPHETERRSMFLSNIDQVLNFDVQTLHFFASHVDFPPERVVRKLKSSVERLLVPYDFLAGRLKLISPERGRLGIDCNGAGAGFAVASSECTLDEIGDLVYPNPAFEQLVLKTMDDLPKDDQPLCIIQITSFRCGGFVIGIQTNHATFDGLSFKTFLDNLAAVAADKPLAVTPCNDRQLLAARSPPRVTFPHPELLKLNITTNGQECNNNNAPVFDTTQEALDFKIFRLTAEDISLLKEKARTANNARISGFNAVTAHIWRCKALSSSSTSSDDDETRVSTLLFAVDIRPRLRPPLPPSYAGNAVLTAYATAKAKELEVGPFWRTVEMVAEGVKRMSDEYARSAIDWGEMNKGFPHGEVLVSSWWKLGFDEVEYPWGRPKYSCPLVYHRKDIILLFPDIHHKDRLNVLVALPANQMDKFQTLFHNFLTT